MGVLSRLETFGDFWTGERTERQTDRQTDRYDKHDAFEIENPRTLVILNFTALCNSPRAPRGFLLL
jgi:hypothetical protein